MRSRCRQGGGEIQLQNERLTTLYKRKVHSMKSIMIFLFGLTLFTSCDNEANFYKTEYRVGLWITSDKKDTLKFVDGSNLIRKGYFYSYEEYLYKIDGKTLFIRLPNSTPETQHRILTADGNRVTLENMYITIGTGDNSGTFFKD